MFSRRKKVEEKKEEKKEDPMISLYKHYCKKPSKKVPKEIGEAVEFLRWDVKPECVPSVAAYMATVFTAVGFVIPFFYALYLVIFAGYGIGDILYALMNFEDVVLLGSLIIPFIMGFSVYYYFLYYPVMKRDKVIHDTLPDLPETMGYMTMSLKLTPNLEKALEMAGENGKGLLAEDFKRALWEIRIGLHTTTEEAIDRLAYRWGKFLPEIKHALMQIRSAVLEPDDARRQMRLDQSLSEVIDGVRRRVEDLASGMYMPSVQLFYLGVFLPLLLFIIMPVGAAFSNIPMGLPVMVGIYIIGIPAITYVFAKSILSKRPQIYEVPEPKDENIPDMKRIKNRALMISLVVLLLSAGLFYFLHLQLDITYDKAEVMYCGSPGCLKAKYGFTSWSEGLQNPDVKNILSSYDTTPYWLIFGIFASIVFALGAYFYITQRPKAELQKKYEEMEGEFKDTIYLLASRMGEGKPLEGALDSVMEFMPDSLLVKEVFSKISYNIKVLGLSLRDSVFDPLFGALKDIPSKFLRKAMNILVRSIEMGTDLAAKALLAYSEQLRKEEKIVEAVRRKMSEIYTMMISMAVLVGPIVLGITVALQQVIINSLSTYQPPQIPQELQYQMGINIPNLGGGNAIKSLPSTTEFLVIVLLYNLILTALLTYYSVEVYEGKNRSKLLLLLAKNLSISVILFMISAWGSVMLVRGMLT